MNINDVYTVATVGLLAGVTVSYLSSLLGCLLAASFCLKGR